METPVARHGQLRVEGGKIVDQNGQPTQLVGMSFFWSNWKGQYYTKGVVDALVDDWGVSLLRASMGIPDNNDGGYLVNPDLEIEKVMTVVDACIARGIYVIIDWHDHHAEDHVKQSTEFFSKVAELYGAYPNIIFEPYNEPLGVDWSTVIKPYHEQVLAVIRPHSQNIVILGTRDWCQKVEEAAADPVQDDNVALCLHFYASSHGAWLRSSAEKALNMGSAVFVSEWGTCEYTGNGAIKFDAAETWYTWMDQHGLSSANWAVSDKQESCSALLPGASTEGEWKGEEQLTGSGRWLRKKIQSAIQAPSDQPASPTPTPLPTAAPTQAVTTNGPISMPTAMPTSLPTPSPTSLPMSLPTTALPTSLPTSLPSSLPTSMSTPLPTSLATPLPTSSTQPPQPKPSSAPTDSCIKRWAKCGGKGWSGAACCQGNTCKEWNPHYSQCVPSPETASPECSALWAQCGGKVWQGSTCCEAGAVCEVKNTWYSQCTPASSSLLQATTKKDGLSRRTLKVHRPFSGEQVMLQQKGQLHAHDEL
jgi:endoglucanase